jgi:cytochrome b6-f complex iron-sulfur subunit
MNNNFLLAIAAGGLTLLALVVLITTARRRDARVRDVLSEQIDSTTTLSGRSYEKTATGSSGSSLVVAPSAAPVAWVPPDPEVIFGGKINAGKLEEVQANIKSGKGFFYLAEGRAWITEFPKESLAKAQAVYKGGVYSGMQAGLVALYQKCPHLGCRVPECKTSQWFECPCHGSQYNRVGEKKGGPAPRGMDHFAVAVENGNVIIDTGALTNGPAIGVNTTGQEAEGPHCVGGGH